MFAARPNPRRAYKELRTNLLVFGTLVAAVRVAPYLLHLYQKGSSR